MDPDARNAENANGQQLTANSSRLTAILCPTGHWSLGLAWKLGFGRWDFAAPVLLVSSIASSPFSGPTQCLSATCTSCGAAGGALPRVLPPAIPRALR